MSNEKGNQLQNINNKFLNINLELPDNIEKLNEAEIAINNVKKTIANLKVSKSINEKSHEELLEKLLFILDYVGRLSIPVFNVNKKLENSYMKIYYKTPALAKELWLKHYGSLHHPYNILKNRCYNTINELDKLYVKKFKKNPPNWKYNSFLD